MKKILFIILMGGLAYGQDSTVTQVVERFSNEMNIALDQIQDFQTQINSLRVRILALEYAVSNVDTVQFTIEEIEDAITVVASRDTSTHTLEEIDEAVDLILGTPK